MTGRRERGYSGAAPRLHRRKGPTAIPKYRGDLQAARVMGKNVHLEGQYKENTCRAVQTSIDRNFFLTFMRVFGYAITCHCRERVFQTGSQSMVVLDGLNQAGR